MAANPLLLHPWPTLPPPLDDKLQALRDWMQALPGAVTAFSGGVDSALVAYMAHRVLAERALAVTADSPALTRQDLDLTRQLAQQWCMAHQVIRTAEMQNPSYQSNPANRCLYCKSELYSRLAALAQAQPFPAVLLSGTNADDLHDHRPGLEAAQQHGVRHPLAQLGITKPLVRQLALALGLPNHHKPQTPCLASRVAYGIPLSPQLLQRIEIAEDALRALGFSTLRLRHHGTMARLEVPLAEMETALRQREAITAIARQQGWNYITLDLEGFRSGNLNVGEGVALPHTPSHRGPKAPEPPVRDRVGTST